MIDIEIENNRKYLAVALLIDRDDFLGDIESVRDRIHLSEIPYIFPSYPYDEANRIVNFYEKGQISINGTRELLEEFCSQTGLQNLYSLDKTLGTAVMFAESLAKKYKRDRLYIPVILASILVAHIKEEDFLSTQMYEIDLKTVKEELMLLDKEDEILTIKVNRESTKEEILSVFDFIQKYYFKSEGVKNDGGLYQLYKNIPSKKLLKTANKITRDREWYWMYKNEKKKGKGIYERIMKNWEESHPPKEDVIDKDYIVDKNVIEQAISRYKELLKADI